jgi:hypothetical protein
LTAISVSRECGIVEQGTEIYVPRIFPRTKGFEGPSLTDIVWEEVDDQSKVLDPTTLQVCCLLRIQRLLIEFCSLPALGVLKVLALDTHLLSLVMFFLVCMNMHLVR